MGECIEREAAIREFNTNGSRFVYGLRTCRAIQSRLRMIPAADVRPVVRGKWRLGGYGQVSDATVKWYDCFFARRILVLLCLQEPDKHEIQLLPQLRGEDGGGSMSILIKGMEMPKDCTECWFRKTARHEYLSDCQLCPFTGEATPYIKRKDGCPLVHVPAHGRLIDADKLCLSSGFSTATEYGMGRSDQIEAIKSNAPTIIPAEEAPP